MSGSNLLRILAALFVLCAVGACRDSTQPAGETPEPTAAAETQQVAAEAPEGHDQEVDDHDCAAGANTVRLEHDRVEVRTAEDGTSFTHAGAELEGVEEVTIAELLADPDKWEGQVVAVSGNVSTMCSHRRSWFGLVNAGDQSGKSVQVRTAPSFLVPAGSVGRTVRAEGKVEVVEISPGAARYLAEDHKIGEPEDISGPQKRVIIAATGADFI